MRTNNKLLILVILLLSCTFIGCSLVYKYEDIRLQKKIDKKIEKEETVFLWYWLGMSHEEFNSVSYILRDSSMIGGNFPFIGDQSTFTFILESGENLNCRITTDFENDSLIKIQLEDSGIPIDVQVKTRHYSVQGDKWGWKNEHVFNVRGTFKELLELYESKYGIPIESIEKENSDYYGSPANSWFHESLAYEWKAPQAVINLTREFSKVKTRDGNTEREVVQKFTSKVTVKYLSHEYSKIMDRRAKLLQQKMEDERQEELNKTIDAI